jgi:acyl-homoserine lactone acylase PvdQ
MFVDSAGTLLIATGSEIRDGRVRGSAGFAPTRARATAAVLGTDSAWTIQRLIRASFDTRVFSAPDEIRLLADEWEQVGARSPERAARVDSALNMLREWNGVSTVGSEAMSLFAAYHDEVLRSPDVASSHFTAMENVIHDARRYPPRPWGSVNAARRGSGTGDVSEARSVSTMPLAGAPARNDIMFSYDVGNRGQHYVWVADLHSGYGGFVMSFGASNDGRSVHWFDQATLFAAGSLRTVILSGPPPAAGYHPGAAVPGTMH